MKKYCYKHNGEFETKHFEQKLCDDCFKRFPPKCKYCGKPLLLSDVQAGHDYHNKCFIQSGVIKNFTNK